MKKDNVFNGAFSEKEFRELLVFGADIEPCRPYEDWLNNKFIMTGLAGIIIVLLILFFSCSCIFLRYKKMKSQYYQKINLIRDGAASARNY